MRTIDLSTWPRRKHFEVFSGLKTGLTDAQLWLIACQDLSGAPQLSVNVNDVMAHLTGL